MRRSPSRRPIATSIARMKGFHKKAVGMFLGHYRKLLVNGGFLPTRIWNWDETRFTSVAKPPKVVCAKGINQMRKMSSDTNVPTSLPPSTTTPRSDILPIPEGSVLKCDRQLDDLQQAPTGHAVWRHPALQWGVQNIASATNGFRAVGLWPFDDYKFDEEPLVNAAVQPTILPR